MPSYDYLTEKERKRKCRICGLRKKKHEKPWPRWWTEARIKRHKFRPDQPLSKPVHQYRLQTITGRSGRIQSTWPDIRCIDGQGSWSMHVALTKDPKRVTCEECIDRKERGVWNNGGTTGWRTQAGGVEVKAEGDSRERKKGSKKQKTGETGKKQREKVGRGTRLSSGKKRKRVRGRSKGNE